MNKPDIKQLESLIQQLERLVESRDEVIRVMLMPKTIHDLAKSLENRIAQVMSETGKKPGDFVAMQNALSEFVTSNHPLITYREKEEK